MATLKSLTFKMAALGFLLLMTAYMTCGQQRCPENGNVIGLDKGGYIDLLVAIQKDVEEDEAIIEQLKEIFTAGSARLFSATNNRVYWKSITILVPITWSRRPEYDVAQEETYENANVRVIESPTDRPSVSNPYWCGCQGQHMLLPREFITESESRQQFGPTDKVLVQQWAKLRWGVFEEYYHEDNANPNIKPFYQSEGTRCSADIHGSAVDTDGSLCQPTPFGHYPASCRFVPDQGGQTASTSLMFATDVESIDSFCHDDPDKPGVHNYVAPNAQNEICDGQSVWEVMRKTSDFYRDDTELPADTDTEPTFNIVQPGGSVRVLLVIDISGSMEGDKFNKMIQGATHYIRHIIPEGSHVGIVQFSETASVNSYLVAITDTASREMVVESLPTFPDGNTCIGCGILSGISVLQRNGADPRGGFLILLTDGLENKAPYIRETLDDIDNAGIIIDTIAFGRADEQLEDLATMTVGLSSTCSDHSTGQCVIDAFSKTVTERPDSFPVVIPVQLLSTSHQVLPASTHLSSVDIDDALGVDTVVAIPWLVSDEISVKISGPDNTAIDDSDPRYHLDRDIKMITVVIDRAEPGTWTINVTNPNSRQEYVGIAVHSKPVSEDVTPVISTAFLGSKIVDFLTFPALPVYAHVHRNYEPVLGADVTAVISSSVDSNSLTLEDNGLGADLQMHDGIYSGYFLNLTNNGRYGVVVDANGTTESEASNRKRRSPHDASSAFSRTTSAGVFVVENFVPGLNIDVLPPSKIRDLRSEDASYGENRTVTLTWTAVGDDFVQGKAARYELRYSTEFLEILKNFSSSPNITDADIVRGSISEISYAGLRESMVILLPNNTDANATFSLALRAWDEAGNVGSLSNIVSVYRHRPPLLAESPPDGEGGLPLSLIIGIAVGVLVAVTLLGLGAALGYFCSSSRGQGENDNSGIRNLQGLANPGFPTSNMSKC